MEAKLNFGLNSMIVLQVSRKAEQSDAEGLLLRRGAKDHLHNVMPVAAPAGDGTAAADSGKQDAESSGPAESASSTMQPADSKQVSYHTTLQCTGLTYPDQETCLG